jgi:UDPglucose 6-dehydrogenase
MVAGKVKWYNDCKGYGFITSDLGGPSILAKREAILNSPLGGLIEDQRVMFAYTMTPDGPEATGILIDPNQDVSISGIIGHGIVGKATQKGLIKDRTTRIHDIALETHLEDLTGCDHIFFCTPTDNDDSIIKLIALITEVKLLNPSCKIILRSTVPVGTCKKIEEIINDQIIYIPEFLRERCWETDCTNRPLVVGSNGAALPKWLEDEDIIRCSLEEAEVIKMLSNNMATARVVFANHFYELSNIIGADYDKVLDSYLKVNHDQNYLEVNENIRAFGGKCLPKDLDFLINTFKQLELPQTYFTSIKEDNQQWPVTVRKS